MIEEKTMCDRVGKDYVYILEKMCGILRHYQMNYYINDESIEKIEELCLGIETGKMEIIEFGQVLSKRNNIDKYIEILNKIKEILKDPDKDGFDEDGYDDSYYDMIYTQRIYDLLEEIE